MLKLLVEATEKAPSTANMLKDNYEEIIQSEGRQLQHWREHFSKLLSLIEAPLICLNSQLPLGTLIISIWTCQALQKF